MSNDELSHSTCLVPKEERITHTELRLIWPQSTGPRQTSTTMPQVVCTCQSHGCGVLSVRNIYGAVQPGRLVSYTARAEHHAEDAVRNASASATCCFPEPYPFLLSPTASPNDNVWKEKGPSTRKTWQWSWIKMNLKSSWGSGMESIEQCGS